MDTCPTVLLSDTMITSDTTDQQDAPNQVEYAYGTHPEHQDQHPPIRATRRATTERHRQAPTAINRLPPPAPAATTARS